MLKFIPAEAADIKIGVRVEIRHPMRPCVGTVTNVTRLRNDSRYFTVAREIDSIGETFRFDEDLNVYVQVDAEKRMASVMRSLKTRANAVPLLRAKVKLVDGPFNGQEYNPRSHEETLVITCKGQTGRYERANADAWGWVAA